jgi:exonuclease VII small subunit
LVILFFLSYPISPIVRKKKKDYDYEATAEKLNSMIEDLERTEKDTVLEIWKEYQKAPLLR